MTGSEAHRLVLPPRPVVVRVDPRNPGWEGEVEVGPDATEAELELRPAGKTGPRIR
jgi:hypothetical protein